MTRLTILPAIALATTVAMGACADDPVPAGIQQTRIDSVLPGFLDEPRLALTIDTLARGLVVPWGVAAAPDGRLFVTERPGRIRVLAGGVLTPEPWATLDVHAEDPEWGPESGLMGIALSPDFPDNGHVFVLATRRLHHVSRRSGALAWLRRRPGTPSPSDLPFRSAVIRFTDRDGQGRDPRVIIDSLPANHYHAGGGLAFGPDGMLYVSIGDILRPELAQRADIPAGKILRYTDEGRIPDDNPSPDSPVWSAGLRNSQSFVWLSDGTMLGVDHGPSGMAQEGGRWGDDELNVIRAGGNYGWPATTGWQRRPGDEAPAWVWGTGAAVSGMAVHREFDSSDTVDVLVAGLRGRVERLRLSRTDGQWRTTARDTLLNGTLGRVRTIIRGEAGFYLTTSNRDARGKPRAGDDLVVRLGLTPQPE